MSEREKKAEIFQAQYPERYTGEANTEAQPRISDMMKNYNKNLSELRIRNVCNFTGVKIYRLPSIKGFDGENGQLFICNMFTLKQCRNKPCKMSHLLPTNMGKEYLEQLVKMLSTGAEAAVTKP